MGPVRCTVLFFGLFAFPALAQAQTVNQVVASNGASCTTAGTEGLSEQLVRSHLCAFPGSVAEFAPHPNITLTHSRVHPLGAAATVTAIQAAADTTPLTVNSAFRTLVEQYLLFEGGGCGLAATPGNSNHQTGTAVDLGNFTAARSAMTSAGCTQSFPSSDPVHFDCPGPDMRANSVLIFQRLWNLNNPSDTIAEDGAYGGQTRTRLGGSPSGGFPMDLCDGGSGSDTFGATFVAQSFPLAREPALVLRPGEERAGTLTLRNAGTATWDSNTRIGTTLPRDHTSPLQGTGWLSASRPAVVTGTVAPGAEFTFMFTLRGPTLPGEYCDNFGVVQEGAVWFSDPGQLGPPDDQIELCVLVVEEGTPVPDAGPPPPLPDAGPPPPLVDSGAGLSDDGGFIPGTDRPGGATGCGCRAVGAGADPRGLWLFGLAWLVWVRRRASVA
ncbi:MAG: M15 family metallopeptidase [Sandaracinaceae bacterium]